MRYIENGLTAFSGKLYHSGIKQPISLSTLADDNERRDERIYADLAQVLIRKARPPYFDDKEFRLDLDNVV